MSYSYDRVVKVKTTPTQLLTRNERRYSWDITNTGSVTIFYLRGEKGANISTSGPNRGIPINPGGSDGWDDLDAIDEVWAIAPQATEVHLSETIKYERPPEEPSVEQVIEARQELRRERYERVLRDV